MVMQHPVTSDVDNYAHTLEILKAIEKKNLPTLWFASNIDAGQDELSRAIADFSKANPLPNVRFISHLPAPQFLNLLKRTACLIGNSSAGIKECSYLGVPYVLVGNRQQNRYQGQNVAPAACDSNQIITSLDKQLAHGPYQPDHYFYQPATSERIIKILEDLPLYTQKEFHN